MQPVVHPIRMIHAIGLMQPMIHPIRMIHAIGLMQPLIHPIRMLDAIGLTQPLMQTVRTTACSTNSDAMHVVRAIDAMQPIRHCSTALRAYRRKHRNERGLHGCKLSEDSYAVR